MDNNRSPNDSLEPSQVQEGVGKEKGILVVGGWCGGHIDGAEFPRKISNLTFHGVLWPAAIRVAIRASHLHHGVIVRASCFRATHSNPVCLTRLWEGERESQWQHSSTVLWQILDHCIQTQDAMVLVCIPYLFGCASHD